MGHMAGPAVPGGGLTAQATVQLDRWLFKQNPAYRSDQQKKGAHMRTLFLLIIKIPRSKDRGTQEARD